MRFFVAFGVAVLAFAGPGRTAARAAEPAHMWSKHFGGIDLQAPSAVTVDGSGNVILVGRSLDSIDFGGGAVSAGLFMTKFTPAGEHVWSKRLGEWYDDAVSVAANDAGDILIGGMYTGTIDLGGGPLPTSTAADAFLARFDSAGNHVWSIADGGVGTQSIFRAVLADDGSILITEHTDVGPVDLGGGLPSLTSDARIARLDASGAQIWSRLIADVSVDPADAATQECTEVAGDPSGNVYAAGRIFGTTDLGGGAVTLPDSVGCYGFLAKYDQNGAYIQAHIFDAGLVGFVNCIGVRVDASGNVVIAGDYTTAFPVLDFGGGPMPVGTNAFVASFDPSGGHRWSRAFDSAPDLGNSFGLGLDVAPDGDVSVTGRFLGEVTMDSDTLKTGIDQWGAFSAKFDGNGVYKWSKGFYVPSIPSDTYGTATDIDDDGSVIMAGVFSGVGTIDFGGDPFTANGYEDYDAFLVKFQDPTLNPVLITQFEAHTSSAGVLVRWGLWSDETLRGFTLYRAENDGRPSILTEIEDIHAREFIDRSVEAGKRYQYQLVVHGDGSEFRSPSVTVNMPELALELGQNRPNPFNPETMIPYTVPGTEPIHTQLRVFDVAGRLVRTLVNGPQTGGAHRVRWNGLDDGANPVSSGVYFSVLEAGKSRVMSKMVLLK